MPADRTATSAPPADQRAGTASVPGASISLGPSGPIDAATAESRVFGRYQLRYRIASGGMAAVYLAQHEGVAGFRRWSAIKIMHPQLARDERLVTMFLDEARLAAKIVHPNVCSVFDFGEQDGTYYLAMEYLHGEPLSSLFTESTVRPSSIAREIYARIVADATRGLHAAHELRNDDGAPAGVVHRDVSPQNIFVAFDGAAKLVDFGVARWTARGGEQTAHGEFKGKVSYASPEQIRARGAIDRRSDVFSMGIVLWETTTGQRLFKRATVGLTMAAVTDEDIPPPSEVTVGYPPELERVVMRALERDPAARFATADEMVRALEAYLARAGVPAGVTEVGDVMRALFAGRLAQRDELLRLGGFDPTIAMPPPGADALSGTLAPSARGPVAASRPSRVALIAGAALAIVGVVSLLVVGLATRPHRDAGPAFVGSEPVPHPLAAAPQVAPVAPPLVVVVAAPAAVDAGGARTSLRRHTRRLPAAHAAGLLRDYDSNSR